MIKSNYFFNPYALPLIVVAAMILVVGAFVFKQNFKSKANQIFFFLCISLFAWLTGHAWMYLLNDAKLALQVYRSYTFIGVSFIGINIYTFTVSWLKLWKSQKWVVIIGYVLAVFFYIADLTTNLVTPFVEKYPWGFLARFGWLGFTFFGTFLLFFAGAFFNLIYRLQYPMEAISKSQVQAVIIAFGFGVTGSFDYIPTLGHVELYPFGYISAFFWILGMSYAIVKFHILDIQTAIHKSLFWAAITLACLLPLALVAYFLRDWLLNLPRLVFSLALFGFTATFLLLAMQVNLKKWNKELEEKVEERTRQLTQAQAQLIQAEKLASIGTLAGGIAHEINNSLIGVVSNVDMIISGILNVEETNSSLEQIKKAGERCRATVQKLMFYVRKPLDTSERQLTNINEIVENTLGLFRYQLEQDNISIVTNLQARTLVFGHPNELSQVFTNLILNARDAVQGRRNEAQIKLRSFESDGEVSVEIEDNGKGIDRTNVSKIFDPFFTTKEVGKGTGLGLTIARGIVQGYGGSIDVKSEVGMGTTVAISLPKGKL